MKVDAEPLGDDALEVDPTPAHDAVLLPIRTGFDDPRQLSQSFRRQARLGAVRPVVDKALRARCIEAMDPVAQGLAIHAPDPGLRPTIHSIPDRSQRQKPTALIDVLRSPGQRPKLFSRIVLSQSHR